MKDEINDIVVCGYWRMCMSVEAGCLPQDIAKLVCEWYCGCYVHLLERTQGSHWKIGLNDIMPA